MNKSIGIIMLFGTIASIIVFIFGFLSMNPDVPGFLRVISLFVSIAVGLIGINFMYNVAKGK